MFSAVALHHLRCGERLVIRFDQLIREPQNEEHQLP